jgi:hypothetical protein
MAGRMIESTILEQPMSFDLVLDFPPGLYYVCLQALGQSVTRSLTLLD